MSSPWNLEDLPEEVLFHISLYLNDTNVWFSLRGVCRRFYTIFSERGYWRKRMLHRWGLMRSLEQIEEKIQLLSNVFAGVPTQRRWEGFINDTHFF